MTSHNKHRVSTVSIKRTVHNKHRESFNDDNEAETNKIKVLRVSTQSINSQYHQGQVTINTEYQKSVSTRKGHTKHRESISQNTA